MSLFVRNCGRGGRARRGGKRRRPRRRQECRGLTTCVTSSFASAGPRGARAGAGGGPYLEEVGELRVPRRDHTVHLVLQLPLLLVVEGRVVLGEPRLPLPVLQQDETDLRGARAERARAFFRGRTVRARRVRRQRRCGGAPTAPLPTSSSSSRAAAALVTENACDGGARSPHICQSTPYHRLTASLSPSLALMSCVRVEGWRCVCAFSTATRRTNHPQPRGGERGRSYTA